VLQRINIFSSWVEVLDFFMAIEGNFCKCEMESAIVGETNSKTDLSNLVTKR
jgi:hypothetical protein